MPEPPASSPLSPDSDAPGTEPVRLRAPWYRGAYYQLALSILLSTASQPLLKVGADQVHLVMKAAQAASWQTPVYFLMNGWAWLGISAQIVSLLGWVYALRSVQLNIAFNLTGIAHVLVPLASWVFLGEYISPLRWAGILLVFLGVVITAQEAVKLEEKL
jgi:undecaprenyl phosphate-alpha-L-ara4N flippase subunit ArnF